MKKTLAVILFMLSTMSYAVTTITNCGVTLTNGSYNLTSNLSSASSTVPCITVESGSVTIAGQTHTISNSLSNPAPLIFVDPGASVKYKNIKLSFVSGAEGLPLVLQNQTTIGGTVSSSGVTLTNGTVSVSGATEFTSTTDTYINATILVQGTDKVSVTDDSFNESAITVDGSEIFNATGPASSVTFSNNTATGNQYVDDIAIIQGPVTKITVEGNTIGTTYNGCIEFLGTISSGTVENNQCSNVGNVMIGGYYSSQGNYWTAGTPLAIENVKFISNTLTSPVSGNLFSFFPVNDGASVFSGNTLTDNISMGNPTSLQNNNFGNSIHPFVTVSNNTLTGNNFTTIPDVGFVNFYPNTGYTDGGGNICYATMPVANVPIVCGQ